MAGPSIIQIEKGAFALAPVDRTVAGYSDDWQTPTGAELSDITAADYGDDYAGIVCQVTDAAVTASANDNDIDIPATFCEAGRTISSPDQSSFAIEGAFLQDPHVRRGMSRLLFQFDTQEFFAYLGARGDDAPKAAGRVRIQAGNVFGEARANLEADLNLPFTDKPDIMFGSGEDWDIVKGDGTVIAGTGGTGGQATPTVTIADQTVEGDDAGRAAPATEPTDEEPAPTTTDPTEETP